MRGYSKSAKSPTPYYRVYTALYRVESDLSPLKSILTMDIFDEIYSSLESPALDLLLHDP
jgi:hypothetical protein